MNPHELPVYKEKQRILDCLAANPVVVVESPTGSGKTTQLPIILHEAGYSSRGVIGVTQPRRIATLSVSDYIARQFGSPIPGLVGYKMRFEDKTNFETRVKIMTDGTLLQEIKADPLLSHYSVLMVDEAHERSLNIDFILGLLKNILKVRDDFKVIISSATINAEIFSTYFDGAPVVHIETATYPVQIIHEVPDLGDSEDALIQKIAEVVGRVLRDGNGGDILCFLPGEKAIKDTTKMLWDLGYAKNLMIVPLYGRLSKEEQERVFLEAPEGKTKLVLSTNIAETSVTIDGITVVIDSGLAKINYYNPKTFTSSLIESTISKASCQQRKGRAGRTQEGVCYRLYSREDFEARDLYTLEEIYRTDLSEVVLRMAEIGIRDFESFDFLSQPNKQGIHGAVEALTLLEALNPDNSLSNIGKLMVQFPLAPRHSRMIVEAIMRYPGVLREVSIAATFLSTDSPFLLPQGEEMEARRAHHAFQDPAGDFVAYLKIFDAFLASTSKDKWCARNYLDIKTMEELVNIQGQLEEIISRIGVPISAGGPIHDFLVCVAKGLIQFVCIQQGRGAYRSLTAEKILIHPGSGLFKESPQYIVAGEIVRTTRMYARSVSPIRKEWLNDISPNLYQALTAGERLYDQHGEPSEARLEKPAKNSPWQLQLGKEAFTIKALKGKDKLVTFDWPRLSKVLEGLKPHTLPDLKTLKGEVTFGEFKILEGVKAGKILEILRKVDLAEKLDTWPAGLTFTVKAKLRGLVQHLDNILKPAPIKPGSKTLGFLTLYNDNHGQYWFRVEKNFTAALGDSMASLETLADDAESLLEPEEWKKVNATYRRLDGLF